MRTLNLGPDEHDHDHDHDHDHGHDHHADEHADHDHSGLRRRKRSSHGHHDGHEGNTTWDQVPTHREKTWLFNTFPLNIDGLWELIVLQKKNVCITVIIDTNRSFTFIRH